MRRSLVLAAAMASMGAMSARPREPEPTDDAGVLKEMEDRRIQREREFDRINRRVNNIPEPVKVHKHTREIARRLRQKARREAK